MNSYEPFGKNILMSGNDIQDSLMSSIKQQVENELTKLSDNIIESRVEAFKFDLVKLRNAAIIDIMNSIEIHSRDNASTFSVDISINSRRV